MSWTAPVGIPTPAFGIEETYRMYDEESARNPALTYHESPSGGYYTHYISYPDGSNSENPYGTVANPRDTIPGTLPAGSIVEVHGGPAGRLLGYGNFTDITASGTSQYPVFIRGVGGTKYTGSDYHAGFLMRFNTCTYMIIEDLVFENVHVTIGSDSSDCCIRNTEHYGVCSTSVSPLTVRSCDRVVVYDNHIHHNGLVPLDKDTDVCGVVVYTDARYTWIVDNEINHNDGDAIIVNGSGGAYDPTDQPEWVYIGRNVLHDDKENAIDLKDSDYVVISQNEMYGYNDDIRVFGADPNPRDPGHTSDHSVLVLANEGNTSHWLILNDIHDCYNGVMVHDAYVRTQSYILANKIYNMEHFGILGWEREDVYFVYNIVYNVGSGFIFPTGGGLQTQCSFHLYNNVIQKMNGNTWAGNYYEYLVEVKDSTSAGASLVKNNVFYDGDGYLWAQGTFENLPDWVAVHPDIVIGNLETDPEMTDPANGDFSFQAGSPVLALDEASEVDAILSLYYSIYGESISTEVRDFFGLAVGTTTSSSTTSTTSTNNCCIIGTGRCPRITSSAY